MSEFYGDNFRWFMGVVVDHSPPAGYEGRVKVRIYGIHPEETDEVSEADLPWAMVMLPGTEAGVSGIGRSTGLISGAKVYGLFLDGQDSNVPTILGVFPSANSASDIQNSGMNIGPNGEMNYTNFNVNVGNEEKLFQDFNKITSKEPKMVVTWTKTYNNQPLTIEDIKKNAKDGLKYHYVITRDGTVEKGLDINTNGQFENAVTVAFVGGYNCPTETKMPEKFLSNKSLTREQMSSFNQVVRSFKRSHARVEIVGANEVSSSYIAPGFKVSDYVKNITGDAYVNTEDKDSWLIFLPHTDKRIKPQLKGILEAIAREFGKKLTITSAYRSPAYNAKVGGASDSQHTKGNAVDVVMSGYSTSERIRFIQLAIKYGITGVGVYNTFTHVDIGNKRAWGPNGSRTSLGRVSWARKVLSDNGYSV